MRTLYFDCFSGASGDMVVGALIDAGAPFDAIRNGLKSLGVSGYEVSADKIQKSGIAATQFKVAVSDSEKHPHRHLADIERIIAEGRLPDSVKEASVLTFRRIGKCEAEIHGTTIDKIHFHEVGAVDSIVDVVGAHLALDLLKIERVQSSALHVGAGMVKCAHGYMPVPAPATAMLLEGVPCYGGEVQGELVTPTGAALISQLATEYGPIPPMTIRAVGYGSGTKDIFDRPNVLRVLIGETSDVPMRTESITVLEANVDDMNPELLPPLLADLLARGARDAFITPILGKKGRPAQLITVLCEASQLSAVLSAVFRGSSTLGVRMREERRVCLDRDWKSVSTPWGTVRIKIGIFEGRVTVASPEFEECRARAEAAGVPVFAVYQAAQAAAVKGEFEHA
ncbi:MAG: nickel pincer cofactor biosynthesis protein LarC [Candidatus Hydrogenedentes bacterium]|nr:nickel pincer cofactor biosynthesis protein LarC [Candidatus Hydrogenedentota bacterium]